MNRFVLLPLNETCQNLHKENLIFSHLLCFLGKLLKSKLILRRQKLRCPLLPEECVTHVWAAAKADVEKVMSFSSNLSSTRFLLALSFCLKVFLFSGGLKKMEKGVTWTKTTKITEQKKKTLRRSVTEVIIWWPHNDWFTIIGQESFVHWHQF